MITAAISASKRGVNVSSVVPRSLEIRSLIPPTVRTARYPLVDGFCNYHIAFQTHAAWSKWHAVASHSPQPRFCATLGRRHLHNHRFLAVCPMGSRSCVATHQGRRWEPGSTVVSLLNSTRLASKAGESVRQLSP